VTLEMTPMTPRSPLLLLLAAAFFSTAHAAAAQRLPVPVLGRTTEVTLEDGTKLDGELIEATGSSMLLGTPSGYTQAELPRVTRVRIRQHDFTSGDALTWVGIAGAVAGAGMTVACTQVEGTSCGGVFPVVALSFGFIGGIFALGITSSGWRELPVEAEALRAYARFPQGAPPGFVSDR
jgi:hypothetical protein